MNEHDWFTEVLQAAEEPEARVPVDAAQKIVNGINRRRHSQMAATAIVVALVVAAPVSYLATRSGSDRPADGTTGFAADVASSSPSSAAAAVTVPEDLVKQLAEGGYELTAPPASANPTVGASDAVTAAHDFVSPDHPGVALLYSVTTPNLGDLADAADPQSKILPLFDHTLVWVVVFNVMVPNNAGGGYGSLTPSANPLVPATVAVFVDATTGKAVRASLF